MPPSESVQDQAAGLRRMVRSSTEPVQVITVTGGKGGVGKTTVSINLGMTLAQEGHSVMIFDADLGLANVDVLLGLHPRYNLSHVLSGERTLEEVVVEGPHGIRIVPAASGIQQMAELSPSEHAGLVRAFSELSVQPEVLIVDTAAGISDAVICFSSAAQHVVVVVCDEPASITDAYALIKILSREHGVDRFHIVANMADSPQASRELYAKLCRVTDRFLDVLLELAGSIPRDDSLRKAIQRQRAVVDLFPRSQSTAAFKKLAKIVTGWPTPSSSAGRIEFFVERLIKLSLDRKETAT
ncbi:Antiactivator FleN [Gammaproteobacteria bacterium]